jgi:hypothetical protein
MAKILVVPTGEENPYEKEFYLGDYDELVDLIKAAIPSAGFLDLHGFTVADGDGVNHKIQAWVDDLGGNKDLPTNRVASAFAGTLLYGNVVFTETIGPETVSLSDSVIVEIRGLVEKFIKEKA